MRRAVRQAAVRPFSRSRRMTSSTSFRSTTGTLGCRVQKHSACLDRVSRARRKALGGTISLAAVSGFSMRLKCAGYLISASLRKAEIGKAESKNYTRKAEILVRSEKTCVSEGESPSSLEASLPEFGTKVKNGRV